MYVYKDGHWKNIMSITFKKKQIFVVVVVGGEIANLITARW